MLHGQEQEDQDLLISSQRQTSLTDATARFLLFYSIRDEAPFASFSVTYTHTFSQFSFGLLWTFIQLYFMFNAFNINSDVGL